MPVEARGGWAGQQAVVRYYILKKIIFNITYNTSTTWEFVLFSAFQGIRDWPGWSDRLNLKLTEPRRGRGSYSSTCFLFRIGRSWCRCVCPIASGTATSSGDRASFSSSNSSSFSFLFRRPSNKALHSLAFGGPVCPLYEPEGLNEFIVSSHALLIKIFYSWHFYKQQKQRMIPF